MYFTSNSNKTDRYFHTLINNHCDAQTTHHSHDNHACAIPITYSTVNLDHEVPGKLLTTNLPHITPSHYYYTSGYRYIEILEAEDLVAFRALPSAALLSVYSRFTDRRSSADRNSGPSRSSWPVTRVYMCVWWCGAGLYGIDARPRVSEGMGCVNFYVDI